MLEAQRNAAGIRDEAANVQHQVFGDALIAQHREVLRVSRLLQGCDRRLTNASPKTVSERYKRGSKKISVEAEIAGHIRLMFRFWKAGISLSA